MRIALGILLLLAPLVVLFGAAAIVVGLPKFLAMFGIAAAFAGCIAGGAYLIAVG